MLKANILRYCGKEYYDARAEDALHKGKRIDTMMKTIKFVGALYQNGKPGKFPKLEELFAKLFPGETFPAHDALQDVKALRRCVPELVELGIIELKQKEYPAEQLKAKFEPEKSGNGALSLRPEPRNGANRNREPQAGTRPGTGTNPGTSTPGGRPE